MGETEGRGWNRARGDSQVGEVHWQLCRALERAHECRRAGGRGKLLGRRGGTEKRGNSVRFVFFALLARSVCGGRVSFFPFFWFHLPQSFPSLRDLPRLSRRAFSAACEDGLSYCLNPLFGGFHQSVQEGGADGRTRGVAWCERGGDRLRPWRCGNCSALRPPFSASASLQCSHGDVAVLQAGAGVIER